MFFSVSDISLKLCIYSVLSRKNLSTKDTFYHGTNLWSVCVLFLELEWAHSMQWEIPACPFLCILPMSEEIICPNL